MSLVMVGPQAGRMCPVFRGAQGSGGLGKPPTVTEQVLGSPHLSSFPSFQSVSAFGSSKPDR